ncbi:hypothetical protein DFJ74DRAFT_709520 [Hyaloraphidium curvatum]|nr:hypothetical protein DFJ74DRAFT_709520 [Hyaloraphidium curvatum]
MDSPPLSFTDREWLALFPMALPAEPTLAPADAFSAFDPAAALRTRDPLTPRALVATLGAKSAIGRMTRWQLWLTPLARRFYARSAFLAVAEVAGIVATGVLAAGSGLFSSVNIVIGLLAISQTVLLIILLVLAASWRRSSSGVKDVADLSGLPQAQLARWMQLVGNVGTEAPKHAAATAASAPALVTHKAGDQVCPCPDPGCAGSVAARVGRLRVAELAGRVPIFFIWMSFLELYTVFVTFASTTWTSWYGAPLFVLSVAKVVLYHGVNQGSRFTGNVALSDLSTRLRVRAARLALSDFLARYEPMLSAPAEDAERAFAAQPDTELYQHFHASLAREISSGLLAPNTGAQMLSSAFATIVLGAVINAAVARCIPFYAIWSFYLGSGSLLCTDLVHTASRNRELDAVADTYLWARREISELLARRRHAAPCAVQVLRRHRELLAEYAGSKAHRARFLGFVVDATVLRNLFITAATVSFALFGILKSFGVAVVMDSICPG